MRARAALAALLACAAALRGDATSHAPQLALSSTPPPPVLFQNLLPPDSVCADKTDAAFYAGPRDPACPCDCIGCKCRHAGLFCSCAAHLVRAC
jgi:hypothetical protein